MEVPESLIYRLQGHVTGGGIQFAIPSSSLRTHELDLGLSNSLFYWDEKESRFRFKTGIYVAHFSLTSLHSILDQFSYAATCLRLIDIVVNKIEKPKSLPPPTVRAFACSVRTWLRMMRDVVLIEEVKVNSSHEGLTPSLLGLSSSLSSLVSGSEYLFQIVNEAIPQFYFEHHLHVPAADIAVHILNHLYMKLNEICLLQGGQEDAYRMLIYILVGTLLPYIESLDSWLFHGTLDDPFEEMFFVANKQIAIDEAEFWENSYQPRSPMSKKTNVTDFASVLSSAQDDRNLTGRVNASLSSVAIGKEENKKDIHVCPIFIKDITKTIISTGKSLQLIRHGPVNFLSSVSQDNIKEDDRIAGLTLSEAFCVSVTALVGYGDHVSEYLWKNEKWLRGSNTHELEAVTDSGRILSLQSKKYWQTLMDDILSQKRNTDFTSSSKYSVGQHNLNGQDTFGDAVGKLPLYYPENPAITVCRGILEENKDAWKSLNISQAFCLPPLNDEALRLAIYSDHVGHSSSVKNTDYTSGFHFNKIEHMRFQEDAKILEILLPFPTVLPHFREDLQMTEVLPFQNNSTLPSRIMNWIQNAEPKSTLLPAVILQECLTFYIKKQADYIGRTILQKLLHDWRLLDELGVLRAIYLLGSGDLLQHFLTVIFNKLDKGESFDDDFELNTILQESIRNSADNVLRNTSDCLVVSVANGCNEDEPKSPSAFVPTPRKVRGQISGMDVLESLKFTYKVSWPLELIANLEATKKYNQVMIFLLKVKRAKFVLDKTRRWMWKDRRPATIKSKRHWLLEQKLLHFVDAFHHYVMDRVYHNAWHELCEGVAAAGTLDEAIEVHEAYLQSIQRQCFVVPDKLGGLIAIRINTILALALDFYTIQQTLNSGGAIPATRARCEKEAERIEKQFDGCMAFLLRILSVKLNVGQFPHLAALVTRINYNCFYMSDGGILTTAPSSSTFRPTL